METLDKDLLEGIRKKDQSSFKILYDKYSKITLRQISSRISDADLAKDLFQDFWLFVWTSADLVRTSDEGDATKSLFFILSKRILDHYRQAAKEICLRKSDMQEVPTENMHYSHIMESIIEKEIVALINQIIANLPELDQMIFDMRVRKQYSIKETAQKLDIGEKSVQNRMTKISGELRARLTSMEIGRDMLYLFILLNFH